MRATEKKVGLILGGIFLFSLMIVGVVMAFTFEEASAGASVTINSFVDITLTDTGIAGFRFGSLDPGDTNIPEDDQNVTTVTPAATVTRNPTSNVDVKVRLKGTNFVSSGDNIPIGNVDYDDDEFVDDADSGNLAQTTMTTTYPVSEYATLDSGSPDLDVWFWLDVPTSQAAGNYASTFSFEGNSV